MSKIPEITFRTVPEGGEENYGFLNFFLPNLDNARKVSTAFKDSGIDGCFHYYDNNWHYVRKWDHLKELKSLYPLSEEFKDGLNIFKIKTFFAVRSLYWQKYFMFDKIILDRRTGY